MGFFDELKSNVGTAIDEGKQKRADKKAAKQKTKADKKAARKESVNKFGSFVGDRITTGQENIGKAGGRAADIAEGRLARRDAQVDKITDSFSGANLGGNLGKIAIIAGIGIGAVVLLK